MFIINLHYTADIKKVDTYLEEHRKWLDEKYKHGLLLCSGPKNPRNGGVIIALGDDRSKVELMLKEDPFAQNNVAKYTIEEFTPIKYHLNIASLVNNESR